MGIKTLDPYIQERKHAVKLPLSVLSESRIGIDASFYIQNLLESEPSREPLLAATGGLPLALTQRIEADLRVLEKLHIKPVFVFPGLAPNKRRHLVQMEHNQNDACRDRREAWTKYENDQEDAATRLWEKSNSISHWELWRMVLRVFRHRNVEFLVAPYMAWAQVRSRTISTCHKLTKVFHSSFTFNAITSASSIPSSAQPKRSYTLASRKSLPPST
ncbi:PIN domain-like protein [Pterulicium gracile]|uniref:PIN domain-like protein n=1 Tax=Pterulicium gracile TaxID=1884261 RepID=A0A5C3QW00_9AGAR|nr:PIN domain-like protein [Pterula gracilis]